MLALDHDQLRFNCLFPPQDYGIPEPLFQFDSDNHNLISLFPGFPAPATVDYLGDIPVVPLPVPKFELPAEPLRFSIGRSGKEAEEVNKKQSNGNGETLSAQSIAARHRRRRITHKTRELGKLIPGGNKMNTADMFQAAAKHVKFLEAQISILQSMGSLQNELGALVTSPVIQQKLYSKEKCLVPTELLRTLANGSEFQSQSINQGE
ncbi:unnamed protein product [Linum trigynum]|uniref:BHLH domain-containing protein n=1 Tax=Linum trigynum TaxID=586398 RepID=A0AAV2CYE3_9ROSI